MKHKILKRTNLGSNNYQITVELLPENKIETETIKRIELGNATEIEREQIDNYLSFNLQIGNYSIISLLSQINNVFAVKVFMN